MVVDVDGVLIGGEVVGSVTGLFVAAKDEGGVGGVRDDDLVA